MPAVSKAQQQAAGAALAAKKKGKTAGLKGAAKSMAKMTKKELKKVASTKHKGLPKHVNESVDEGEMVEGHPLAPHLLQNLEFWVVEKATRPSEAPTDMVFKSDPIHFAKQIMAGLDPANVLGFYLDENEAMDAAHDEVSSVFEAAKSLEEKKHEVASKIEETIKKLQKEVNRCMEEGKDGKAQQIIQKIAELRSKHQMVEASKKEIEKEEE